MLHIIALVLVLALIGTALVLALVDPADVPFVGEDD